MTLLASTLLAPHFAAWELNGDAPGITAAAEANLYKTAAWLESARAVLGVPLDITSGWRSATYNAAVGGSKTSDHVTGLAADFKARGLGVWSVYRKLKAARLPAFDQIIVYPLDGHIHIGVGTRLRGEYRVSLLEGGYPFLTPELEKALRGAAPAIIAVLVVGLLLLWLASQKGA